jgi:hypothetical protein
LIFMMVRRLEKDEKVKQAKSSANPPKKAFDGYWLVNACVLLVVRNGKREMEKRRIGPKQRREARRDSP